MISFLTLVPLSLCTINAKSKRLVAGLHSLSPLLVHCFSVRFCPCNRVPSFWRENLCLEPSVSKRDTCLSLSVETFSLRLSLQSCLASANFNGFLFFLKDKTELRIQTNFHSCIDSRENPHKYIKVMQLVCMKYFLSKHQSLLFGESRQYIKSHSYNIS